MDNQSHFSKRPISPHLTIYKLPLNAILSILHRITGVGLFFAFAVISWWMIIFILSKFDPDIYLLKNSSFITICLVATSFGFVYHLLNGIRHLLWDIGLFYGIRQMQITSVLTIILSIILTTLFWVML